MTISQVIQTISLGNFTYFTVLHAYFSQISPHSCDNAAMVRHQCYVGLGYIGMDWIGLDCIGHGLNWHGADWHGAHWLWSHCPGPFGSAKTFYIDQKTPHKQESVLFPGTAPAKNRHPNQKNESEEKNP